MNNYNSEQNIKGMTKAAFMLMMSALWPQHQVNKQERARVEQVIRGIISHGKYCFNNYVAFCERVMLYQAYLHRNNGKVDLEAPESWIKSAQGYFLARKLHVTLEHKRIKDPLYKIAWKGLAEAVLDLVEEESTRNYHYWDNWLAHRRALVERGVYHVFYFLHTENKVS